MNNDSSEYALHPRGKGRCHAHLVIHGTEVCLTPWVGSGGPVRLCKKHAKVVADQYGFGQTRWLKHDHGALINSQHEANQRLCKQIRDLEAEIRRLTTLPPKERIVKPAPKDGVIYFLRVNGYVKIGWTSDLQGRMRQYQPDSQLLAVKPGTRKDERAIHRKHAHLLTHGREWFPLAPQITEEADRIVKEFGPPPVVDFSARKAQRIVGPRLTNYVGGPNRGHLPPRTVAG